MKAWQWIESKVERTNSGGRVVNLLDGRGRTRSTIWENVYVRTFVWHTWDEHGTGGENAESEYLQDAKDACVAAIVRQGWAPGGWKVTW